MNKLHLTRPQHRRLVLIVASTGAVALLLGSWIRNQSPDDLWSVSAWSIWFESTKPIATITLVLAAVSCVAMVYLAMVSTVCLAISVWHRRARLEQRVRTRGTLNIGYGEPELASPLLLPRWLRIAAPTWLIIALLSFAAPSVGASTTRDESAASGRSTISEAPVMVLIDDAEASKDHPTTYLPRSETINEPVNTSDPVTEVMAEEPVDQDATPSEFSHHYAEQSRRYVVQPGDHLWSIADHSVSTSLGGTADDDQVRAYWLQLIELNRGNLVDPQNADLIFPGQELTLPPPG